MYYIINKTTNTHNTIEGNYPMAWIDSLLDKGDDIIVISTYSNTIKIPIGFNEEYGEYVWKEYNLPAELFK